MAERAVVTGGTGFIGSRIVALARARGDDVRVVARRAECVPATEGVTAITADIRDSAALRRAFTGADVVYHSAARTGLWGPAREFFSVNVAGTQAVLDAARAAGVPRLVYTSTPSVIGYARDIENGNEALPYARRHESAYAASKRQAEELVLRANGKGIATLALRPHLVIGPGDRAMLPPVIERALAERLAIIGAGRNRVDLTYVDNAAWAHLDAASALTNSSAVCAGRAYFITNGEPVLLWEWLNQVLTALGLPSVQRRVRYELARVAGGAAEVVYRWLPNREPPISRALVAALARSHWYDITAAQRDLNYHVRMLMTPATQHTVEWLMQCVDLEPPARRRARQPPQLPDYYITPTHDFTQYTRDYEEQHWKQHTAFDWSQDVATNLAAHVEALPAGRFAQIADRALPLVVPALSRAIRDVRMSGLNGDIDALHALRELVPGGCPALEEALVAAAPIAASRAQLDRLRDQLAVLEGERDAARELARLGLVRHDTVVRAVASAEDSATQRRERLRIEAEIQRVHAALARAARASHVELSQAREAATLHLARLTPGILAELENARALVRRVSAGGISPLDADSTVLRELVWRRQVAALRDLANHALVVEQSAIAPLTMGVIHYRRRREIQEAMTTFVNDEAKHSAVFRRFLADKLHARERIPADIIRSSQRYFWLARLLPSGGIYLAVIVEAIGAAYLEFFGIEEHMPEPLFRSICHTISQQDERRHLNICTATYNELYRRNSAWEQRRNRALLRVMLHAAYGNKTEDHPLLQACCAFGVPVAKPYQHVAQMLSAQLARIGITVGPQELLRAMGFSADSDRRG